MVHMRVSQPLVFDDVFARRAGLVGAAECVLALLVLTVVCCCAQVFAQQLRWPFGSCAVLMPAQLPRCARALSHPLCPMASRLGVGPNPSPASRCHGRQHGRHKHRELFRAWGIAVA